jgi:hypothetical protein
VGTPDANDRTIECVFDRRSGGFAAGGAVSSQGRAFRVAGSRILDSRRGILVNNLGGGCSMSYS